MIIVIKRCKIKQPLNKVRSIGQKSLLLLLFYLLLLTKRDINDIIHMYYKRKRTK
jgi:hypothetical protein